MPLSPAELAEYRQHGVVVLEDALSPADLAPLIADIEAVVDRRARELHDQGKLADLAEGEPFDRRFGRLFAQCPDVGRGIDVMQARGRATFEFLRNPRLLDLVEPIVGPEILCSPVQHLRAKPPDALVPKAPELSELVPWHQDLGVIWEEAERSEILTVWVPLVDATLANGCMEVLPGVFRRGFLPHHWVGRTTIVPEALPAVEPRPLPVRAGGVVLMHMCTPHRGRPNRTGQTRWSLDLRYQKVGTPTGRPFYPAFVARSRANPASELHDYETWCRQWHEALEQWQGKPTHRFGGY